MNNFSQNLPLVQCFVVSNGNICGKSIIAWFTLTEEPFKPKSSFFKNPIFYRVWRFQYEQKWQCNLPIFSACYMSLTLSVASLTYSYMQSSWLGNVCLISHVYHSNKIRDFSWSDLSPCGANEILKLVDSQVCLDWWGRSKNYWEEFAMTTIISVRNSMNLI